MKCTTSISRRHFLQGTAAGLAAPLLLASPARARAANDRITLGFIGVGRMARSHLQRYLGEESCQVVALAEVVQERLEHGRQMVEERYGERAKGSYQGCAAYVDFREILERDDIDAVVISTPDHWHAIPAVMAAEAKKDIYLEKPLTHNIVEGRKIVEAVQENGVVLQTGSQQRSEYGGRFRKAVELIRNGRLGTLKTIRVGVGDPAVPCDLPEEPVPEGTDWDRWLGPAPQRGYHHELCPQGIHDHWPAWRRYKEYAGGQLADMGAHHFDIAQWALAMDDAGPVRIEPPEGDERRGLKFIYADGVEMFHGGPSGCTFEGERGTLYVDRGTLESDPPELVEEPLGEDATRVYHSTDHHSNWLECIRSRELPICHAEVGHRSATVCHLGNIGYWLRRTLRWDPEQEHFVEDDEANELLWREPRQKWDVI